MDALRTLFILAVLLGVIALGIYTEVAKVQACKKITGYGTVTCILISGSGGRK